MLFESNFDFNQSIEYKKSKVYTYDSEKNLSGDLDFSFRISLESINRFVLDLPDEVKEYINENFPKSHIPRKWMILKYGEGNFFNEHVDKDHGDRMTKYGKQFHVASILLFPPKNLSNYEGGELVINYNDGKKVIVADDEKWTCVFFKLGTLHHVKIITKGTRYVMKGFIFENY